MTTQEIISQIKEQVSLLETESTKESKAAKKRCRSIAGKIKSLAVKLQWLKKEHNV